MRKLLILRHSKAGQTNKQIIDDHGRNLTTQGVELCSAMAEYMLEREYIPDIVLCSTASRAVETAQHVCGAMSITPTVEYTPKLYLASTYDILRTIQMVSDEYNHVLVVGHNPGLQQFCLELPSAGDKKEYRELRNNFPPPSLAVFHISGKHWMDLEPGTAELVDVSYGKKMA